MPDYSNDYSDQEKSSDDFYSTSRTAQLLREEAASAARTNYDYELTAKQRIMICNIMRPKRKSPHEVENISVSSEPKATYEKEERNVYTWVHLHRKKYTCSHEGCTNQVQKGGVFLQTHGAPRKKYT